MQRFDFRNLVRHRILTFPYFLRMEIFLSSKLNLSANQSLPGAGPLSCTSLASPLAAAIL